MSIIEKVVEKVDKQSTSQQKKVMPHIPTKKVVVEESIASNFTQPTIQLTKETASPEKEKEKEKEKERRVSPVRENVVEQASPIIASRRKSDFLAREHKKIVKNSQLGQSTVISVDRKRMSKLGFLSIEDSSSQMAEEYRLIKRQLINNALGANKDDIKHANLILITSSQPGEGKTFTAINLALSIASERDKKVLLIDADVAKPSVSEAFGIDKNAHGLIDYLDGEDLSFAMMQVKTSLSGLRIIPAGKKHGYSTELLASDRMAKLAEELHSRYPDRIVIFDSPPLLATTHAAVLAEIVGQVVLVIEAEKTLQRMVTESVDQLTNCKMVLALLNKSTRMLDSEFYGYGTYGNE